jgi:hypothetical protein
MELNTDFNTTGTILKNAELVYPILQQVDSLNKQPNKKTQSSKEQGVDSTMNDIVQEGLGLIKDCREGIQEQTRIMKEKYDNKFFENPKRTIKSFVVEPITILHYFESASSDPVLYNATTVDVLDVQAFSTRIDQMMSHTSYVLSKLVITPIKRLTGQFNITSLNNLKNSLVERTGVIDVAVANVAGNVAVANVNTFTRDEIFTFRAEMDIITALAEESEEFMNRL